MPAPASPPFKKTCPCTILPPPSLIFQISPLQGRKSKFTPPPPFKKGGGPNYDIYYFHMKTMILEYFQICTSVPLTNSSVLQSTISFKTHSRFNSISFEKEYILKIIRNFNVNKAHSHDNISIWMLKICNSEVVEPLLLIYNNCIDSGIFWYIKEVSYHSNI